MTMDLYLGYYIFMQRLFVLAARLMGSMLHIRQVPDV